MTNIDAREAKKQKRQARRERWSKSLNEAQYHALFQGHEIKKGEYRHRGTKLPIAGAVAEFESGADNKRITGTRVIAGGILFGPAGAVVGGALRKNKTKCYVTITFADGQNVIIEAPIKDENKARQFVSKVNNASAYYADRD